jgi:hypothetical protein
LSDVSRAQFVAMLCAFHDKFVAASRECAAKASGMLAGNPPDFKVKVRPSFAPVTAAQAWMPCGSRPGFWQMFLIKKRLLYV